MVSNSFADGDTSADEENHLVGRRREQLTCDVSWAIIRDSARKQRKLKSRTTRSRVKVVVMHDLHRRRVEELAGSDEELDFALPLG